MHLQNPLLSLDEREAAVSFSLARLLQGLVLGMAAFMLFPVFWGVFYPVLSGDLALLTSRSFDLLALALRPFPKSQLTSALIATILALRSASWGRIGFIFCLSNSMIVAALVELCLSGLSIFNDMAWFDQRSSGRNDFLPWLVAWGLAAACFYLVVRLGLFHRRSSIKLRSRTVATFWMLLIYGIYTPILYEMVWLLVIHGENLVWYLVQGARPEEGQALPRLLVALFSLIVITCAKRMKEISNLTLILLPFVTCLLCFSLVICINPYETFQEMWDFGQVLFFYALILSPCTLGILRLLGVKRNGWHTFSPAYYGAGCSSPSKKLFFVLKLWAVIFLVGPPFYQAMNIILRGLIIGFAPPAFFLAGIEQAYLHVGIIFAGATALYAFFAARIHYPALFLCALATSLASAFLPAPQLGISLGFFADHIGWPMLLLLPSILVCGFIFERNARHAQDYP